MKEFDLNIEKVLENWTVSHALREIIANALDEQILTQSCEIKIFLDNNNNWHIRDYGRGLKYIHLTQNENEEKMRHHNLIGKFGVGLKDALATFDRNSKAVKIISKYGTITLGKSHKHGFDDITTLHAYISESEDTDFVGTDFVISNCSQTDIDIAKNMFLKFSDLKLLEKTNYGEVYEKTEDIANIYFNGVKVAEEDNFLFSYNITSLTASIKKALNRERTNVGRSAYSERIKAILLQAESENVIKALTDNLNKFSQGSSKDELKWSDVATHAVKMLNSRDNVVFITPREMENASNNFLDILKSSGKDIVFVPDAVKEKVVDSLDNEGNGISTFSSILEEYTESFEYKFVEYSELHKDEKKMFNLITDITKSYDANYLISKICISETIKPDLFGDSAAGVWDAGIGKIVIRRDQLKSIEDFAGTLIHELVHAHKHFDDVDREFESELTRIIGILAGTLIRNNLSSKIRIS